MKFKLISTDVILFGYMLSLVFEYMLIQNTVFVKICQKNIVNDDLLNATDYEQLNDFCDQNTLNKTTKLNINDELTELIHNYNLILFIVPMITTFFIGSWSDLFGRRLPILLNLSSSAIVQMIMITFYRQPNFEYFKYVVYGCAFISSLTGGAGTMISSCYAYVVDVTTSKNLTHRLAILQTFSITGSFVGYNLFALLISKFNLDNQIQLGFSFLLFLHLSNIFISCICVKTKAPKENQVNFRNLVSKQHFLYNLQMVYRKGNLNTKLILFNLCAIFSFYCLAIQQISLFAYLKRPPFSISSSLYGYFQASFWAVKGISLIVIFPKLNAYLRSVFVNKFTREFEAKKITVAEPSKELNQLLDFDLLYQKTDTLLCMGSFVSKFAGLLVIGLMPSLTYLPLIPLMFCINEFSMPTLRSLIVKQVNADEKGKSLGLLSFFQNFCFLTGSLIFKRLFALTRDIDYGLSFDLVALSQLFSIIILIFIYRSYKISSMHS